MTQFIQIFLGILIVLLGILTIRKYPLSKKVDKLTKAALLVVITLILKRLTIMIPLFGAESLKLGFEYLPMMIAGFLLGPSYGFMIGLCCDLIGLIITPTGFPFLGFTLGTILVCWIPGMVRQLMKELEIKKVSKITFAILLMIGLGAMIFVYSLDSITISSVVYEVDRVSKMILMAVSLLFIVIFGVILLTITKKMNIKESKIFPLWLLSVVLVELVVTLGMTPTWLQIMYGIPYWLSACVRIIKLVFVIPLEIIVGFIIVRSVDRLS